MGKSADAIATREHVYQQMLAKFPAKAIAWVRTVKWSGPTEVPCDQIDSDDRSSWTASHDPHKVEADRRKIDAGQNKPAILIRGPGGNLVIVDGHHRFLAADSEGKTLLSWIGSVPSNDGPWSETHSSQIGGPSN